jgi:hypothetical protein
MVVTDESSSSIGFDFMREITLAFVVDIQHNNGQQFASQGQL